MKTIKCDLCVIGAGSGGLSVAAGAAQLGVKVVLLEHHKMGGDCLNYGCVPSKSLLSAAKRVKLMRDSEKFGITAKDVNVDFAKVNAYVHKVIAAIAPHDSVERFENFGVTVIQETGKFIDDHTVAAGDKLIQAKRFVIATGSLPAIPPLPGLEKIDYLTNRNIFELKELPQHLIILGGGPIGCELAQAHRLLGAKVTVIQRSTILNKDEPEFVDTVRQQLTADGIDILEHTSVEKITQTTGKIIVHCKQEEKGLKVTGSHLLVATGQTADVSELNLEAAAIKYSNKGIEVNAKLQTSNKKIYAIGDVTVGYKFTHVANYHAGIVIRNAIFHLPAKVNYKAIVWCTYTEPELAHVGLTEAHARDKYSDIRIIQQSFADNDRAQAEGDTQGGIKIIATRRGYVLGVSIVGHGAGELILPWSMAISKKLKLKDIAGLMAPYPTRSELSKIAAGDFYKSMLFSPKVKKIVKLLQLF